MAEIIRVLVPLDSHSSEAFGTAIGYAQAICKKASVSDVILLTHTKHQLDHTSLSRFLGDQAVRSLAKGPVGLGPGVSLHAETMRTLRSPPRKAVLIVYYAEIEILDFADGVRNVVGVVAVPDLPGEADGWAKRWGVIVHGQDQKPPAPLIEDEVVVRALKTLTQIVNLSTGLGHPRDKVFADEVLRILRAKGHVDPTPHIRSWAIRNGWKPEHAVKLEALSRKVWGLKGKPSLSSFHNPHERYERWRSGVDRDLT
jgi:hypothetical protein